MDHFCDNQSKMIVAPEFGAANKKGTLSCSSH
jgi:hypothetical protein